MSVALSDTGPTLPISIEMDEMKYRQPGESFREKCSRIADALKDDDDHFETFRDILLTQRFLPAGRVQCGIGAARQTTPYNCFVSAPIPDSSDGIMDRAKDAFKTMRLGGGIGYDFSTIRPRGEVITTTQSAASGPVSFMGIYDAVCASVASAGHRRGAQMGVLRVDHPDIEEFVRAKQNKDKLTNFNVSVAITDEFMWAVKGDQPFDLKWGGKVYKTISAVGLWNEIMRSTWDWAEPGVLFIDRINEQNNLAYCETIAATNPCAEQPLPPNGACLLGSFNLVKYVKAPDLFGRTFDMAALVADIPPVIRAMDNIVDRALYPLPSQEAEAKAKRRMGLGVTGVANAAEAMGMLYGSPGFLGWLDRLLQTIANECYMASALLAKEKGSFPLLDKDSYCERPFIKQLDTEVQEMIQVWGIRNSHLTSIAPTGTISLTADNVSSGIEPVFSYGFERTIQTPMGPRVEKVTDYGVRVFGVKGKTADQCSIEDHLQTLLVASKWVDSAVSKTCNVGDHVGFDEFKTIYMRAWEGGAKGCTTFRAAGKRMGILVAKPESEGAACFIGPDGKKTCE